jgi:tRNA U34 2-thiouridine synthase MnmA/TrmU
VELVEGKNGGKMNRFTKGEVTNPKGAPKKLVSSLIAQLKEEGYEGVTNGQISDVISLLLNLNKDRVKQLAEDAKQPIYVQRISRRLVTATDKEIGDFIDKQLDRAHGKPKQVNEHTGKDGKELPAAIITVRIPSEPPKEDGE